MCVTGTAIKYGDNIDTDAIIAARYLVTGDPKELAPHCMEDIDAGFAARVKPNDVIIGGSNFGCGSSREHAPLAIKGCGVACVIAASFARIFYRNSINIGLPILECPEASAGIDDGDRITVNFETGVIKNETKSKCYMAAKFPPFIEGIIESGGLLAYLAKRSDDI